MSQWPAQAWLACAGQAVRVSGQEGLARSREAGHVSSGPARWDPQRGVAGLAQRPQAPPSRALGGSLTEGSGLRLQQHMARRRWLCGAWLSVFLLRLWPGTWGSCWPAPRPRPVAGRPRAGWALASHPTSAPSCGAQTLPGPWFSLQRGFSGSRGLQRQGRAGCGCLTYCVLGGCGRPA